MSRFLLGFLLLSRLAPAAGATPILGALEATYRGETSPQLVREYGVRATHLPRRLDFGDAYSDVVLRGENLGGVGVIVFFEMDKLTGGLKRIQIERPRHGVNPPAARAMLAALQRAYGAPERHEAAPPRPENGFQASERWSWRHQGAVIRAIFRDTTLEAVEGCIGRQLPCGLTGQLLVRIGPAEGSGLRGSRAGAIRR